MYLLLLFFSLNSVLPSQIVFAEQLQNREISDTVLSNKTLKDSADLLKEAVNIEELDLTALQTALRVTHLKIHADRNKVDLSSQVDYLSKPYIILHLI